MDSFLYDNGLRHDRVKVTLIDTIVYYDTLHH